MHACGPAAPALAPDEVLHADRAGHHAAAAWTEHAIMLQEQPHRPIWRPRTCPLGALRWAPPTANQRRNQINQKKKENFSAVGHGLYSHTLQGPSVLVAFAALELGRLGVQHACIC